MNNKKTKEIALQMGEKRNFVIINENNEPLVKIENLSNTKFSKETP